MKPKHREGSEARKKFEETMQKLFHAPKTVKKEASTGKAAVGKSAK